MTLVELRRYRLHPGRRRDLLALFEQHFAAEHARLGITLRGPWADLGDPQEIVWMRAFEDVAARTEGLTAFYGGPVWAAHRDAANETMIDSDHARLLEPVPGLSPEEALAEAPAGSSLVVLTTERPDVATLEDALRDAGFEVHRAFVTSSAPNTFPALPLRPGPARVWWVSSVDDRRVPGDLGPGWWHEEQALEHVRLGHER